MNAAPPERPRRVVLLIAVALFVIAADVISKAIVVARMPGHLPIRLLGHGRRSERKGGRCGKREGDPGHRRPPCEASELMTARIALSAPGRNDDFREIVAVVRHGASGDPIWRAVSTIQSR